MHYLQWRMRKGTPNTFCVCVTHSQWHSKVCDPMCESEWVCQSECYSANLLLYRHVRMCSCPFTLSLSLSLSLSRIDDLANQQALRTMHSLTSLLQTMFSVTHTVRKRQREEAASEVLGPQQQQQSENEEEILELVEGTEETMTAQLDQTLAKCCSWLWLVRKKS